MRQDYEKETGTLSLRLCSTADLDMAALSSTGFASSPATIALSEDIRVAFTTDNDPDRVLGHADLAALGLTALSAWNKVAERIVDTACDNTVASFLVRHLHFPELPRTIQIRVRAGRVSEWVAHPLLFGRLQRCATKVFGSDTAYFHVLAPDVVLASSAEITPDALSAAIKEFDLTTEPGHIFPSLRFYQGFPVDSALIDPPALGNDNKTAILC